MTEHDLLFTVADVTNNHEEDAIGLPVPRNEVFNESLFHKSLRTEFNSTLRRLAKTGLVELTRDTVAITSDGFDAVWDN